MTAILDFMPDLLRELEADFYTDCVDVLHAIETKKYGEICRDWIPVPDPCDKSKCMVNVASQFLHGKTERKGNESLTEVNFTATVDFPFLADWITPQMRIQNCDSCYEIKSIQHDHDFGTRLTLERMKR